MDKFAFLRIAYLSFFYFTIPHDEAFRKYRNLYVLLYVLAPRCLLDYLEIVVRTGLFLFFLTSYTHFADTYIRPKICDLQRLTLRLCLIGAIYEVEKLVIMMIM